MRAMLLAALPPLTAANFCAEIGRAQHIDPAIPAFSSFTPQQRQAVGRVDRMRNLEPKVLRCEVAGDRVAFDKEASLDAADGRRRIYGAVRFLRGRYSTFQMIGQGGDAPAPGRIEQMAAVVESWSERK